MAEKLTGNARKSVLAKLNGWSEAKIATPSQDIHLSRFQRSLRLHDARRARRGEARPPSGIVNVYDKVEVTLATMMPQRRDRARREQLAAADGPAGRARVEDPLHLQLARRGHH